MRQPTNSMKTTSTSAASVAMLIVLCLIAAAATAVGCSWPGTSHSVRFNAYQTEREMGRLPPLPTMANGLNQARAYWEIEDSDGVDYYEVSVKNSKEIDALWERAAAAGKDGNLQLDQSLLQQYLKATASPRTIWFEPTATQERRNSAIDRLDALADLRRGASAAAVKAYLEARDLHDREKPDPSEVAQALAAAQIDRHLRDNVAYLRAAEIYRQHKHAEAAIAFKTLARQYPQSEKREAALFMTAVATMKDSVTYLPETGNSDYGSETESTTADDAWHGAFAAFQKLVNEYPRGKYFYDAQGWQAYLFLRRHDRASALARYYRLLTSPDEKARTDAAFSLTLIRASASEDEMERVENELADEPHAALAYAYHNIYNYAIDPGDAEAPYDPNANEGYQEQLEKEWQAQRARTTRTEQHRILAFSQRLMKRYPALSMGGAFALRAAQASEELGDNNAAISFARRALHSGLNGEERARALWTLGVAQHRSHQLDEARASFQSLLRDYPKSDLTEGARRLSAMIAEDAGDIDGALEQYIALNYEIDVAYFVDVLMTPQQLSAFIEKHPESPKKNELTYALGIRYLRANRWEEARQTLRLVQTERVPDGSAYLMGGNCFDAGRDDCRDPKDGDRDADYRPIITPRLILRDLQTANDLEALEQSVTRAAGDEATAEAMYQLASYQFEGSTLLFYNPVAWQAAVGQPRYWNLSQLAAAGNYRTVDESRLLFDYMQQHETPARALRIYLDIVKLFPRTRAARDALYTAAVCHERLSGYNPYWRDIYENRMHAGDRMVTYADVKATYPNYQLPRGTLDWQPSTRTVNNGPGFEAPPKPPVRLTRRERARLFLSELKDQLTIFWRDTGKRWVTEIIIVCGLLLTMRIARRHQRRLRARMARRRLEQAKQVITYPWFELFWIDPELPDRRERARQYLQGKQQEFMALARDGRTRPVLWRSIASHAVATGLIVTLLWTIWFG